MLCRMHMVIVNIYINGRWWQLSFNKLLKTHTAMWTMYSALHTATSEPFTCHYGMQEKAQLLNICWDTCLSLSTSTQMPLKSAGCTEAANEGNACNNTCIVLPATTGTSSLKHNVYKPHSTKHWHASKPWPESVAAPTCSASAARSPWQN